MNFCFWMRIHKLPLSSRVHAPFAAQIKVNGNCDEDSADYASDNTASYGTNRSRLLGR